MTNNPIPKKALGQHWLRDHDALQAMCEAANIQKTDTVLEIGPGLGTLTKLLVQQADQVLAVEFDSKLAADLPRYLDADNLRVIEQDIMRFDFGELPVGYKVVANIPYYLTSNLIRVMSEAPNQAAVATLLVQKEVAERVAAKSGQMSILSVTAQFFWEISLGRVVEAELFTPPPKVDSQILIMTRRTESLFPDADSKKFFRLVKAGFAQKRKTLLNNLSSGLQLSRGEVTTLCEQAEIDPGRRAQTLSLEEWHNLFKTLSASS